LQVDSGAAQFPGKPLGRKQRRWASGIFFQQPFKLSTKLFIVPGLFVFTLKLHQRSHERFRNVAPAEGAESSRKRFLQSCCFSGHCWSALLTAAMKAFSFSGSLRPGSRSTPLTTSTPQGENSCIAAATFPEFNPL